MSTTQSIGDGLDFRDKALKLAGNKCNQCGCEVTSDTALYNYSQDAVDNGKDPTIDDMRVSCHQCSLDNFEKEFGPFTTPLVGSAAKLWIQSYIKSPVITGLASVVIGVLASVIFTAIAQKTNFSNNETKVSLDFKSQIEQLDATEDSLKSLLEFVNNQRETTTLNEQKIKQLESDKLELEPLVNADKATVEALFKVQEQRALASASKERWLGFGLGILASIIASFVMIIGNYFLKTRRKNS